MCLMFGESCRFGKCGAQSWFWEKQTRASPPFAVGWSIDWLKDVSQHGWTVT